MWKGLQSHTFEGRRALRQVDPLTKTLFNIVLEAIRNDGLVREEIIFSKVHQYLADDIVLVAKTKKELSGIFKR